LTELFSISAGNFKNLYFPELKKKIPRAKVVKLHIFYKATVVVAKK